MKMIALIPIVASLSACGFHTATTDYNYVRPTPVVTAPVVVKPVVVKPVVVSPIVKKRCCTSAVTPVSTYYNPVAYYDPVTVVTPEPVDITTTSIEYY